MCSQAQVVRVKFLGPMESLTMTKMASAESPFGTFEFKKGEVSEIPADLAREVLAMWPEGCTLETASNFPGARLFQAEAYDIELGGDE
jgi:hypothetical protein